MSIRTKTTKFFLLGALLAVTLFASSERASAASTVCDGSSKYCLTVTPSCGKHTLDASYSLSGNFQSDCSAAGGSVSCNTNNIGRFSNVEASWPEARVTCSCSALNVSLTAAERCYVTHGSMFASVSGPSSFDAEQGANFTFTGGYNNDDSLKSSEWMNYSVNGDGLFSGVSGTARQESSISMSVGSCKASTGCEHRGEYCCSQNVCGETYCKADNGGYYCWNYRTHNYEQLGSCQVSCGRSYQVSAAVSSVEGPDGSHTSARSTKTVRTNNCPSPPPKVNGRCGTANGKTYNSSDTRYSPDTQCSSGVSTNTDFPRAGQSVEWVCMGENGGADARCSASRQDEMIRVSGRIYNQTTRRGYANVPFASDGSNGKCGSMPPNVRTDGSGNYSFEVPYGSAYCIRPNISSITGVSGPVLSKYAASLNMSTYELQVAGRNCRGGNGCGYGSSTATYDLNSPDTGMDFVFSDTPPHYLSICSKDTGGCGSGVTPYSTSNAINLIQNQSENVVACYTEQRDSCNGADVTGSADWTSDNPSVATVNNNGSSATITGKIRGSMAVSASYAPAESSAVLNSASVNVTECACDASKAQDYCQGDMYPNSCSQNVCAGTKSCPAGSVGAGEWVEVAP